MNNRDFWYKYMPEQTGSSDCCGAPVIADYNLCSDCKEHCTNLEE
tara:strand:+ start:10321 stop:10455 length:135 start_codon:yes stop_codon:yes gene_type:complete